MSDEYIVAAELLDERVEYTLREVSHLCGVAPGELIELVAEGVVEAQGLEPRQWRFTGTSVIRIQTALRLERDLGLNRAGAALVLELLDDVQELRRRLRRLGGE